MDEPRRELKTPGAPFLRKLQQGPFLYTLTLDGEAVRLEKACVDFGFREHGQGAYEERTETFTRDEVLHSASRQASLAEAVGDAAVDALLLELGGEPRARPPPVAPRKQGVLLGLVHRLLRGRDR